MDGCKYEWSTGSRYMDRATRKWAIFVHEWNKLLGEIFTAARVITLNEIDW